MLMVSPRAFSSRSERDQSLAQPIEPCERYVRLLFERAIEVRRRDELAQVCIALIILGEQHQPIDAALASNPGRSSNSEHGTNDRLHALRHAGITEWHDPIETVPIGNGDCGEAKHGRSCRNGLGLHRSFEHGE